MQQKKADDQQKKADEQQKKAEQRAVLEAYLKEKTENLRNENRRNRNLDGFVILIVQYFERNIGDPEYC